MDEARRHGLKIDERRLVRDLGVPVVPTVARYGEGLDLLVSTISDVATGRTPCKPHRIQHLHPALDQAVSQLAQQIEASFPDLPNARWVALRLLDGDTRIAKAIQEGEIGDLSHGAPETLEKEGKSRLEVAS
jgi:GTP-binding protein